MAKQVAKPSLETVFNRSLRNGDALYSLAVEELIDALGKLHERGADYTTLIAVARDVLRQFEPAVASVLSDAQVASWVLGADELVKRLPAELNREIKQREPGAPVALPPDAGAPKEPPPEKKEDEPAEPSILLPLIDTAVNDLITRKVMTRKVFDAMQDEAKRNAFTVAWQESDETIEVIRDVVRQATQQGWALADFRETLQDRLGSAPMSKWHSELVFRQNVQQGYANGLEKIASHPVVRPIFPFAKIAPIKDTRVRDTHLSLAKSGLEGGPIYWADDLDFWSIFDPPMDFACRCGKNYISVRQAAQQGLQLAIQWLETGIEPPHESRLPFITWRPSANFVGGRRAA